MSMEGVANVGVCADEARKHNLGNALIYMMGSEKTTFIVQGCINIILLNSGS